MGWALGLVLGLKVIKTLNPSFIGFFKTMNPSFIGFLCTVGHACIPEWCKRVSDQTAGSVSCAVMCCVQSSGVQHVSITRKPASLLYVW